MSRLSGALHVISMTLRKLLFVLPVRSFCCVPIGDRNLHRFPAPKLYATLLPYLFAGSQHINAAPSRFSKHWCTNVGNLPTRVEITCVHKLTITNSGAFRRLPDLCTCWFPRPVHFTLLWSQSHSSQPRPKLNLASSPHNTTKQTWMSNLSLPRSARDLPTLELSPPNTSSGRKEVAQFAASSPLPRYVLFPTCL